MNLEQFKTASKDADHQLPRGGMDDFSEVERKFWKNLTFNAPLCGHPQHVDTLFSENVSRDEWNLSRWATADWNLLSGMGDNGRDINGSKVQFSSWKSTTPLQTAPMDMYRVSYIHFGAAKTWYSIPPAEAAAVERAATEHYPDLAKRCDHPLRHCSSLLNPQLLSRTAAGLGSMKQQGSGTVVQTVQKAGEFIVLLPAAFHFGFTHGYNCSESIDIAPKAWVPAGASANVCR
jgi:jumonji domain-containing protein 2